MKFRGGVWGSENGVSFNANRVYVNSCCLLGVLDSPVSPIHRNLPAQECSPLVPGELLFLSSSLGSKDVWNDLLICYNKAEKEQWKHFRKRLTLA